MSDILRNERSVPKSKIDFVKYILTTKYKVRGEFLETNVGHFLKNPLEIMEAEFPQFAEMKKKNDLLEKRVLDLENRNKELLSITKTQSETIERLQKKKAK